MDIDYGSECSMCGKPMSYRYCGMCVSCEQINNNVPDEPWSAGLPFDGWVDHCPVCGAHTRTMGGNYEPSAQWEECEECNWKGSVDYS